MFEYAPIDPPDDWWPEIEPIWVEVYCFPTPEWLEHGEEVTAVYYQEDDPDLPEYVYVIQVDGRLMVIEPNGMESSVTLEDLIE